MKLLVTGGAGFVGSHFVRAVLADALPGLEGARVTVLDRLDRPTAFANLSAEAEHERLDFLPGDIGDAAVVDLAVRGTDAIVNLVCARDGDAATTHVAGTQTLLDAALRHGAGRFLQLSTDEVYGPDDAEAWAETSPLAPATPDAAARAAADLMALAAHRTHGLPVVVVRSAASFGSHQALDRPVPHIVTGLLRGLEVWLDDAAVVRDRVHVDDQVRGLGLALTDGRAGGTYHLGGVIELSDRDVAVHVCELTDTDEDRIIGGTGPPSVRYMLDDMKIRDDLDYEPRVEFLTGLAATVDWYRAHEDWWRPLTD